MSTLFEFHVQGIPKGQPRPRAFARKFGDKWAARVYDAGTAEGWKSQVAAAAKPRLPNAPYGGALLVHLDFYMPRPKGHHTWSTKYPARNGKVKSSAPQFHTGKPDCDNLAKAVLDALTQIGAWKDDAQIVTCQIRKMYVNPEYMAANLAMVSGCYIKAIKLSEVPV